MGESWQGLKKQVATKCLAKVTVPYAAFHITPDQIIDATLEANAWGSVASYAIKKYGTARAANDEKAVEFVNQVARMLVVQAHAEASNGTVPVASYTNFALVEQDQEGRDPERTIQKVAEAGITSDVEEPAFVEEAETGLEVMAQPDEAPTPPEAEGLAIALESVEVTTGFGAGRGGEALGGGDGYL